jgi:hypothetical protein
MDARGLVLVMMAAAGAGASVAEERPRAFNPPTVQPGGEARQQKGWVSVDIAPIADEIARILRTEPEHVPLRIKAPIAVAADACRIEARVLEHQEAQTAASCTALTATPALNRIVLPQLALEPAPKRPHPEDKVRRSASDNSDR